MQRSRPLVMFTVYTEEAFPHLSACRLQLFNQRSLVSVPPQVAQSTVWVHVWPAFSPWNARSSDSDVISIPPVEVAHGAAPTNVWLQQTMKFFNKDQLENDLTHLSPVAVPHNIATYGPFKPFLAAQMTQIRDARHFASNWWISASSVSKLHLVRKPHQSPILAYNKALIDVLHVSQIQNGTSILQFPMSARGSPIPSIKLHQDLSSRNSKYPFYFTRPQIERLGTRLKSNARCVTMSMFSHHSSSPTSQRHSLVVHYYNIADVKFPSTGKPRDGVSEEELQAQEAAHPCVPLDGITGQPLLGIDALVNCPNVSRHVWFTAKQLIGLGARCGVNTVPILVQSTEKNDRVLEYFHVDELQEPRAALAMVGKLAHSPTKPEQPTTSTNQPPGSTLSPDVTDPVDELTHELSSET